MQGFVLSPAKVSSKCKCHDMQGAYGQVHAVVPAMICAAAEAPGPERQVVTDEMWAGRSARWPQQPPATREYYLLRSIFEEHFPSPCALATVPMARPPPLSGMVALILVSSCIASCQAQLLAALI